MDEARACALVLVLGLSLGAASGQTLAPRPLGEAAEETAEATPAEEPARAIAWLQWSDVAFDLAARGPRPILLDLVTVACGWCDEMKLTTYSDPEVIRAVNRFFVPIRVHGEERPDVFARYSMGGGHTAILLLPDGEPMIVHADGDHDRLGGNYYEPAEFLALLGRAQQLFSDDPEGLREEADKLAEFESELHDPTQVAVSMRALDDVRRYLSDRYDADHGGFYFGPKRPGYSWLRLLLDLHRRDGDVESLDRVERTVDALLASPVYDSLEGGVHRYAAQRDWREPLYGKRLDDNAAFVSLLADLEMLRPDPARRAELERTVTFLLEKLSRSDGGFSIGQESDSASPDSVGYFSGDAEWRTRATPPPIHQAAYSGSSARAASALLRAYVALGRSDLRLRALETLDAVLDRSYRRGRGVAHGAAGADTAASDLYLLADQVAVGALLLDAYELTGRRRWLTRASDLGRFVESNFVTSGFLQSYIADPGARGALRRPARSLAEQGEAATWLGRLAQLTHDRRPWRVAVDLLSSVADEYHEQPNSTASYGRALLRVLDPAVTLIAIVPSDEAATLDQLRALAALPLATRAVIPMTREDERLAQIGVPPNKATDGAVWQVLVARPPERIPDTEPGAMIERLRTAAAAADAS